MMELGAMVYRLLKIFMPFSVPFVKITLLASDVPKNMPVDQLDHMERINYMDSVGKEP
jgi:hypothetical protein